ncbi:hypothetical protein RND81_01G078200 [Saponaria officinalis]|uniref:Uncharacterized protein n=1 Tax=Saponaria officinalis TaxID=3572 RepID=A0AAW1ND96_SAPOF
MSFGRQTIIQPVVTHSGPLLPEYLSISQISKAENPNDKFDVLGIVIYVEEKARKVVTLQQRELLVREIVIIDHISKQPLVISTWNDLAEIKCESLSDWANKFCVVGFTAIRVATHKGFSLTTSMSTMIIHDPKGDKVSTLEEWALHHQDALANMQARVLDVRNPSTEMVITTISSLKLKKAQNTLQEERLWLRVILPAENTERVVNAYLGCSNCGKRTDVQAGGTYTCMTCSQKDCISSPRVTFNCDLSDGTSALAITTFIEDSEKLFRMIAPDIFKMKHSLIDTTDESFCKLKSLQASECEAEHVQPLKADAIPTQVEDLPVEITSQPISTTNNARQPEIGKESKDLLLKPEHAVLHD